MDRFPRLARPPQIADLPVSSGSIAAFASDPLRTLRGLWARHGDAAVLTDGPVRIHVCFDAQATREIACQPSQFRRAIQDIAGPRDSAHRRLITGIPVGRERRTAVRPEDDAQTLFGETSPVTSADLAQLADAAFDDWLAREVCDLRRDAHQLAAQLVTRIVERRLGIPRAADLVEMSQRWLVLQYECVLAHWNPVASHPELYEALLAAAVRLESLWSAATGDATGDMMVASTGGPLRTSGQQACEIARTTSAVAHLLLWTLFLTAQHPHVLQQLQAELEPPPGAARTEGTESGRPAEGATGDGTLLSAVVLESLRLFPPASYELWVSRESATVGPLSLPSGAAILTSPFITQHAPDRFRQPELFLPERWFGTLGRPALGSVPAAEFPTGNTQTGNTRAGEMLDAANGLLIGVNGPLLSSIAAMVRTILRRCRLTVLPGATIDVHATPLMIDAQGPVPVRVQLPTTASVASPVSGNIHALVNLPPAATGGEPADPASRLTRRAA
jgi:hypothetical protein